MRRRYVWIDGKGLVEVPPDYKAPERKAPAIHGVKEPFKSMADGLWYNDTRTYERELKARGYEVVGNDRKALEPPEFKPNDWKADLAETTAEYGFNPHDYGA